MRPLLSHEGADEGGIDFIEDDAGKIVGDLFFVAAAYGDGVFSRKLVWAPCWKG